MQSNLSVSPNNKVASHKRYSKPAEKNLLASSDLNTKDKSLGNFSNPGLGNKSFGKSSNPFAVPLNMARNPTISTQIDSIADCNTSSFISSG